MAIIIVTDEDFEARVIEADRAVVLHFWAEWRGECKRVNRELEAISGQRDDVVIATMDIDENPETPTRCGVRSIPTLMIFEGGKAVATSTDAMPFAQLDDWISQSI